MRARATHLKGGMKKSAYLSREDAGQYGVIGPKSSPKPSKN
jgi:hypothetical protein